MTIQQLDAVVNVIMWAVVGIAVFFYMFQITLNQHK